MQILKCLCIIVAAALTATDCRTLAQVPPVISYQGRVQVGGLNFSGTGQFKFAIVSPGTNVSRQATATATITSGFITSVTVSDGGAGYTNPPVVTVTDSTGSGAVLTGNVSGGAVTSISVNNPGSGYSPSPAVSIAVPPPGFVYGSFWSNDGSSSAGSEPGSSVTVPIQNGLVNVFLGDTNLANMQPVPPEVFTQADVRLRIWFNDGTNGFVQLTPDQRLGSVGYANIAAIASQVADGTINASAIADNAVTTSKLANNAVTTTQIQDGTILAADLSAGLMNSTFWKLGGNNGIVAGNNFLGTTDNQPLELGIRGNRALRLEPTTDDASHSNTVNVIAGSPVNFVAPGTYGATVAGGGSGYYARSFGPGTNSVSADFGTVGGGFQNVVQATYSTIAGGDKNIIEGGAEYATIAGGEFHTIFASRGTIAGGDRNAIYGGADWSSILGGQFNLISTNSSYATLGGGFDNQIEASGSFSVIGGGYMNEIQNNCEYSIIGGGSENSIQLNAFYATVAGGLDNVASASAATVPGGVNNLAAGQYSFAAGNTAQANHAGAFVWADSIGSAFASQRVNQFRARATGGVRFDVNNSDWVEIFRKTNGVPPITIVKLIDTSTTAYLSGGGAWTDSSDRNRKKDFAAVDPEKVLAQVVALPVQTWSYTNETGIRHIGPMAQDFHAVFGVGADEKGIATLDESGVALAAIQALNQKISQQAAQLKARETVISRLEERLEVLERRLNTH